MTLVLLRRLSIAAALLTPVALTGQQARDTALVTRPERVVGRVTTDSGAPIAGAVVSTTRAPDRKFRQDTTRADGQYSIVWPDGTGDYLVHIAAPGFGSIRKRVTRATIADSVLTVDAVFATKVVASVARLDTVRVRATRPKPTRGTDPFDHPAGARQAAVEGLVGAVSPNQRGDLDALAATVPGILTTSGGASALGLDPSQNNATLDGMAFGGGAVPREARLDASVATTAYDPSRGGFSGAQVAMYLGRGSLLSRRTGSLALDAPPMQTADRVARRVGDVYTNAQASVGGTGIFGPRDRFDYNVSAQLSRRASDAVSLFAADAEVLAAAGLSADSVRAVAAVLDQLGVPRGVATISPRVTRQGLLLGRVGWSDFDWDARKPRRRSGGLTGYARLQDADALGVAPSAASTQTGHSTGRSLGLSGVYSAFVGKAQDKLTELRSGVTVRRDATDPSLALPSGQVLVGGGTEASGLAAVGFGGAPWFDSEQRAITWETLSETQWFVTARHGLKLTAQSRYDGFASEPALNRAGSYSYASLADLAAGRPSSFTRVLAAPERSGGLWTGALALGDFWRASDRLQLVYGARVEGNRYTTRPDANPEVAARFGARTDFAPDRAHVSPRFGFTWKTRRASEERRSYSMSALGQFGSGSLGTIRGGIGEFRSLPSAVLLSEPVASTGLPGAFARLVCVGEAVPVPDWRSLSAGAAAPAACAGALANFADTALSVTVIDPRFDVPASWRANLAWSSQWKRLSYTVDGIVSLNRHQPGSADLNLRRTPVGALASEGGRATYAPASAIVPATGAVTVVPSRIDPGFGRVTSLRSDLTSLSRQVVLSVVPQVPGWSHVSLSYALGSVTAERRGFDGAAFGDLWTRERARGDLDARHQVTLAAGHTFSRLKGATVTLFGQLRSGLPYTPLVTGDVNGDGASNDRAFVHAPEATVDAELAAEMRSLLAAAPTHARRCLNDQLGRAAGRNSCEGPWSATMNARIGLPWTFIPLTSVTPQRRVSIALHLTNPLGGVDRLLHGATGLRGWGAPAYPEQTLYTVTGFDPASPRYRYRVNSRFGSTRPAHSIVRAPFRVTLDVSIDLSRASEEQQVARFLAPGRTRPGAPLDSAALKVRYARNLPNVYRWVLQDSDSLLLSRAQVEALQAAEKDYFVRVDSLWGALAGEFARLPRDFDPGAALRRQEAFVDAGWEINRAEARRIQGILSPLQFSLVHGTVGYLATAKGKIRIRYFM